jgi:hypothetical protein
MMNNNKYFSAEKIFARLSRNQKQKMLNYSIGDIIEWCAEIEIEVIGDAPQFEKFEDVELTVIDGTALLPCNIYRIKDIFLSTGKRIMGVHNDGDKLIFSENEYYPATGEKIYINYLGIPLDKKGYPVMLKGHEQALYWGCVVRMYEEDYSTGNIHPNVYNDFTIRYESALNAAGSGMRHRSKNELKDYMAVILNAIQKPNRLPLYKL